MSTIELSLVRRNDGETAAVGGSYSVIAKRAIRHFVSGFCWGRVVFSVNGSVSSNTRESLDILCQMDMLSG